MQEELHHGRSLGLSVALGGAMGAALGAVTGHIAIWVGVGIAAYISLTVVMAFGGRSNGEKRSKTVKP